MHKPNFNKVLQHILKNKKLLDQTWPHRQDGKKCFGGFAQVLAGKEANMATFRKDARAFLKITQREAYWLFAPDRTVQDFQKFYDLGTVPDKDFEIPTWMDDPIKESGYNSKGYDKDGYDKWGYDKDNLDRNFKEREL